MALSRRTGQRFQASIWPGFVDAMTGLLLVLMFVLTIFMVVQFVLRETITGQETELDALSLEVSSLARALGLERRNSEDLQNRLGELNATLDSLRDESDTQASLIAALTAERDSQEQALKAAENRITGFEAQVAGLLAERDTALEQVDALDAERARLVSEREALQLSVAQARSEIDAQSEAARLAAARREALEALTADLRKTNAEADARILSLEEQLSEEEKARATEAAAAELLRSRLKDAGSELTAMTLALEEQRRKAEETLTMLAAAEAAGEDLDVRLAAALLAKENTETALIQSRAALEEAEADQGATATQLSEVEAALAQALADADARGEAIETLRINLSETEAALAATRDELAAARGEAEQTSQQMAAARIDLERRLAEALAAKAAAEAELSDKEEVKSRLAAALAAKLAAENTAEAQMSAAEQKTALLSAANQALAEQEAASAKSQRQVVALNQQVAELRKQLSSLQALLDDAKVRDATAQVQLQSLGTELNTALARVAAEERKRRELEEEERKRLEAETKNLEKYRSEFFGRLREVLGNTQGVQVVGDRFVFSSEVLFPPGGADLSDQGRQEIAKIAAILRNVSSEIPEGIDWVIRVDGHTDDVPILGSGEFADNWELSQARALSVVRYMINSLGIPATRLSANGFGEFQPINAADTPEARAQNRRIELKLTEK